MKRLLAAAFSAVFGTSAMAADDPVLDKSWDAIVAQAQEEGSLTFFSWWGEEFWRTAAQDFEDEYGIDVTVVIGDRVANLNKVVSESSSETGTIDVLHIGGADVVGTVIDGDMLLGPIVDIIPDAEKTDRKLRTRQEGIDVEGYVVPVYRNQTGLLYDPDRVDDPPQTWEELSAWIAEHPRQFAFSDPTKGGSGQAFIQSAIVNILSDADRYGGDTELDPEKVADWDAVWQWFSDNEDNYVVTGSNNESIDKLNQGEVSMVVAWDDDTAVALSKGTLFKRAELYIPEMGLPGGGDTLGVLANAPHKAAGLLFIAYLIQPDVQLQMNETIGSYLARTDVSGESAVLPESQRQDYGTAWLPAPYKNLYIESFVKEVLMK